MINNDVIHKNDFYWYRQLNSLINSRPRAAKAAVIPHVRTFVLSREATLKMDKISRGYDTTKYCCLLTAFTFIYSNVFTKEEFRVVSSYLALNNENTYGFKLNTVLETQLNLLGKTIQNEFNLVLKNGGGKWNKIEEQFKRNNIILNSSCFDLAFGYNCHVHLSRYAGLAAEIESNEYNTTVTLISNHVDKNAINLDLLFECFEEIVCLFDGYLAGEKRLSKKNYEIYKVNQNQVSNEERPKSDLEKGLTDVWKEVLNLENITTSIDFFEIGGASIKAIELVAKINKKFSLNLTLDNIFDNPTIEAQITMIRSEMQSHIDSMGGKQINNTNNRPVLFFIYDGTGQTKVYTNLMRSLSDDFRCVSIKMKWEGVAPKNIALNELVSDVITQITNSIKTGEDFYLFGYSGGGVIANEVHASLCLGNLIPKKLILIDPPSEVNNSEINFTLNTEIELIKKLGYWHLLSQHHADLATETAWSFLCDRLTEQSVTAAEVIEQMSDQEIAVFLDSGSLYNLCSSLNQIRSLQRVLLLHNSVKIDSAHTILFSLSKGIFEQVAWNFENGDPVIIKLEGTHKEAFSPDNVKIIFHELEKLTKNHLHE